MSLRAAANTIYSAVPTFDSTKDWILPAAGTLVIIILIVRIVAIYAKKQWGEMITELAAACFVFWFTFFNDSAVNTLKTIGQQVFG
jgi:hypothetical protein